LFSFLKREDRQIATQKKLAMTGSKADRHAKEARDGGIKS